MSRNQSGRERMFQAKEIGKYSAGGLELSWARSSSAVAKSKEGKSDFFFKPLWLESRVIIN